MQAEKLSPRASISAFRLWWLFIKSSTPLTSLLKQKFVTQRDYFHHLGLLDELKSGVKQLPWFFGVCHLANKIIDPQHQGTDHGEEAEEVASVGQFLASTIAQILQLEPAIDHLSLPTGDLAGLVSGVGGL